MVLGSAAVVQKKHGIAVAPPPPVLPPTQRRSSELPDIVLVAPEIGSALAIIPTISWGKVIGIVVEGEENTEVPTEITTLYGATNILEQVKDGQLLLVDAFRGSLMIEPDAIYLAQYTAEMNRLVSKKRIYLDDSHQTSATLEGTTYLLLADTTAGIEAAAECGAEALYVTMPISFESSETERIVATLLNTAPGKSLLLTFNSSLVLSTILRAAFQADITLVLMGDLLELQEVQHLETEAQAVCEEQNHLFGKLRYAFALDIFALNTSSDDLEPLLEEILNAGITRLLIYGAIYEPTSLGTLYRLVQAANSLLLPVFIALPDTQLPETDDLECLLGTGTSGFLTVPENVPPLKQFIREASDTVLREKLMQRIEGEINHA